MSEAQEVIEKLSAEAEEVDRLVADIDEDRWKLPTPAPGWTIAHQIGHLAFIFRIAGMAAASPQEFTAMTERISGGGGFDAAVNAALADYVDDPPEELLARWRAERDEGIKALAGVPAERMVPWLVNPLPPAVLASAGMMELFAHGQDIADALGVRRVRTDRIKPLVSFVVRTWDFGYQARDLVTPDVEFRFELTAPSGESWTFGHAEAEQVISGSAVDFCLLATRRRHRDDLNLTASGEEADHWLSIAQAYRGPAGPGRVPGQFDS
ncbi:TIGR03084 family protein [Actinopolyspora lacussalsi subsp. righensis]|uniref:TIGR03084 family protein n=1 Tax=Actinopolyspora righensis TaxID=995060 RepID=A0A1I6XCI2_9ACTN|nr:TIGR03084 family metal-binding protein [Actinopolyspora righensis]SFT35927.1 TIGR03084 family protein [Actinopolyspora righensis]